MLIFTHGGDRYTGGFLKPRFSAVALLLLSSLSGCAHNSWNKTAAGPFAPDMYDRLAEKISCGHKYLSNKKVAVLPFSYTDRSVSDDGVVVSERLLTRIINLRELEVVERGLLDKVLSELKLQRSGIIDENSIKGLGKILGVEAVVTGTLTRRVDGRIEINARMIKTETGSVIAAAAEVVPDDWAASVARAQPSPVRVWNAPSEFPGPAQARNRPPADAKPRPLTARERTHCPPGMVLYWNFDTPSENLVYDVFGNHDAPLNGPSPEPGGKVNSALSFSGMDNLQVIDSPDLRPDQEVTVEAWVNFRDVNFSESGSKIFCPSLAYCFALCGAGRNDPRLLVGFKDRGTFYSQAQLPLNRWTHAAFTYDGRTLKIYINGKLDSSISVPGAIEYGKHQMYIGWAPNAVGGYHAPFNGLLDELAVYKRALTPKEIAAQYGKGMQGKGYCSI